MTPRSDPAVDVPLMPAWRRRLAIYAPVVVVLVFVMLLLAGIQHRRRSTAHLERTYARIGQLHEVRTRLVDAETGQRGYLITGDPRYLAPYRDAQRDVHALIASLRDASAGDSARLAALDHVDTLTHRRFAIMAQLVTVLSQAGPEAARAQLHARGGLATMAELRAALAAVERAELARLAAARADQESATGLVLLALFAGAVVVLATTLLTNGQFRTYARALEGLYAEQRELNLQLQEQAVELEMQSTELQERNAELADQQVQLETMAVELEASNEELQVANVELEERTAAAEAANRTKAQFLASMSHELRTPLNAMVGYVDLLEAEVHGEITAAQRTDLERIRHNGRHLLLLISDILNFAKIRSGKLELRTENVGLDELIAEAAAAMHPLMEAKELRFRYSVAACAGAVRGDEDRVRQILFNLLSNAVKFTPPGGSVALETRCAEDRVHVDVLDTGVGIPADMREQIFDPFVQGQRGAGGALTEGVGLGLSISRDLAMAMGGTVTVESTPGKGSVFTLSLPRAYDDAHDAEPVQTSLFSLQRS
jgi:signal transduction histidine kinase